MIHGPVFGGGYNQLLRLRKPLEARGWETLAVVPDAPGTALPRLREAGADLVVLPLHRLRATLDPRTHVRFAARFWPEVRSLRRVIRERGIDLVQAHGDTNPHAAIAAHLEGVAVVWQIYDTRTPVPLRRVTMPLVVRIADAITTWGEQLARVHPGVTDLGERWITVFPPVDVDEFRPDPARRAAARERLRVPEDAVLVGSIGVLNPSKGHEHLIRAAAIVRREHPGAVFRILGSKSPVHHAYEAMLRSEAARLGFDRETLDFVDPGSDVAELMPGFDALALTSVPRSEGIPTVILEAMSCGLPVVATNVGAVAELVEDGVVGSLIPPEQPEAVAAALSPLIADPERRALIGRANRERAIARYGLEVVADRHARAYELALEHRARRRANGRTA